MRAASDEGRMFSRSSSAFVAALALMSQGRARLRDERTVAEHRREVEDARRRLADAMAELDPIEAGLGAAVLAATSASA